MISSTELRTAVEIACSEERPLARAHIIPSITDPMGKYWDGPSRFDIEIDDSHALMSETTFKKLGEYSCSTPTGVYPGKMWKCHWGIYIPVEKRTFEPYWILRWFGEWCDSSKRDVLNHWRVIIIA